ncbi:MAG: PEP-CTERM sorting domain-containing protein [Rhodospirillales bacterium]|nr:MAG: PEP-CTERM sorting domain-containing protein [Rhodospirillales bacterium]
MKIKQIAQIALVSVVPLAAATDASAATIIADTVIEFFDSGAGSFTGTRPYGGTFDGSIGTFPVEVPLSYATDGDITTFVSLPTGSFIILGFSTGFVFDGPGLDIFVAEVGGNDELADIFVSSDFGLTFTFLGQATTATVSGFDLADIGFTGQVNAIKIVGLDNFGGSPGFDLAFVQGLEGSVIITEPVPEPGTLTVLSLGLFGIAAMLRRRRA